MPAVSVVLSLAGTSSVCITYSVSTPFTSTADTAALMITVWLLQMCDVSWFYLYAIIETLPLLVVADCTNVDSTATVWRNMRLLFLHVVVDITRCSDCIKHFHNFRIVASTLIGLANTSASTRCSSLVAFSVCTLSMRVAAYWIANSLILSSKTKSANRFRLRAM